MKTMIELFSGSGKMARCFRAEGYETFTIDIDPYLETDLEADIGTLTICDLPKKFRNPDVIWAGLDCTYFSQANTHGGGHFDPNGNPKTDRAIEAIDLLVRTLALIKNLNPKFWFLENPGGNGAIKRIKLMKNYPSVEIYYCQYGAKIMKPTMIYGRFPSAWIPRVVCSCIRHEEGVTNSKRKKLDRSEYPDLLCYDIVKACNNSKVSSWKTLEEYI